MSIGQAGDAPKENGWQPIFLQMANEYVIKSTDNPPRQFELKKSPILRWSQPVRGGDDGATFVWMDRGRPAVIGTIFAYPNADQTRTVVHEFHSLARGPLSGTWRTKVNWQPKTEGVELHKIADAPAPADKAAIRLTQMRAIMREFSARSIDTKDQPWELRLMPQPVVRYETDERDDVLDGAIFAFAQGTDPEILFVLEATRSPKGWRYGCGRFSDYRLELKRKNEVVWQVGRSNFGDLTGTYFATDALVRTAPPGAKVLKDREATDANK